MQIPAWMITDEMKQTEHYWMYAEVFGIDVPLTQSQPTESTHGTHRTTSAPRSPNPDKEAAKSSAPRRSTVIRLRIPKRRSTRLTPPAPVPTVDKADEMILQDTLQVSLAEHKSRKEQEARENVALVDEHLASEEIEKMVDGQENIVDDSSIPRNDEPNIPGTRIEPRSNKESPEVELTKETPVVEITNVVIPVNELTDTPHTTSSSSSPHKKLAKTNRLLSLFKTKPTRFKRYKSFFYELQGRYGYLFAHLRVRFMPRKSFDTLADNLHDVMVETLPTMVDKHIKEQVMKQVPEQVRNQVPVYVAEGLILERQKAKEETERLIAKAILQERGNIQAQISTQIENAIANVIPSQVDASVRSYMSGHILHVHPAQSQTSSVPDQQYQLYLAMKADPQLQQQDIAIWLALQMKFERNTVLQTACRTPAVRPRDQDDPHDDAHPEGENSAKRQKTSEYEAYVSRESSSGQVFQEEQAPSTSGNQEQDDDFDFWTDSYASDDDEIPTKQVSQDIMEEVSLTIDEAKLRKMADEMLRQRCTSGDEHQYHIDQMKNFLKSDIVWESRKEILVSPHPRKTTPLVHSCQKDPEAPALSLINQDLLYLKKGNSGPEKIVLSLHKFPAVIFNDDDIEERTSRWVNKCVRKFNPYARYGVEHWKNPHAKIFYIRKQKEPGKPKEEVYSNSKIIQVVKTYWELGHEHKFITEIVARRANKYLVSITEPDYKNLNKNDIEDIYLLIMNGKVPDYADTGLLWSLSVFIRSTVIWERVHDFQLRIESYQQKVNLKAPTMTFLGIEDHEMFFIIYEPGYGIIYKNSKKEKWVMRHSEIHKFCDATLNRVLKGLKSYNNDIKYGYVQKDLTKDESEYLKLFEEKIEASEINKDGKVIGRGIRKKGLYVMKLGNKSKDKICLATIDENSTLWHRRLGHANMRLILSLASKELVRNLPNLKFDQHFCDAYKIGKQAHASHKAKNIVSTTRCLELLHMDLFDPSTIRSYGGNRYTLVIVDDYSRYTWTRFLKDKTEAFDQFEIFSKKIQNQLGCTTVSIRTNHGREFDNEVKFGEFCNANGYSQNSKAYIILNKHTRKIKESLNVTFDETPSPLVDDDLDEEEAIKVSEKRNLENDIEDETLKIDEIVNIKESRNYPLENIIGNLNQRTLRLVAQGYNQQEGIDYDETYVPVARLESIRILLAYACALDFILFQMDVKSAFLNGLINEEVYVAQRPRLIDFKKPDHVYKLKKALYGLEQAPKAWCDRLKAFLVKHEYKIGMVDNTLFTKKKSSNLIIVQIYVDDIIFGSTRQDMCDEFAKIMHDEHDG
ncbi:retrovirus-related pol polyprotein from transposon TNT 1-94 [Tanacetum coccineum]